MIETVSADGWKIYKKPGEIPTRIPEGVSPPLVKSGDVDSKQPYITADGKVKMFTMSEQVDADAYNVIVNAAAKGEAIISREEVVWSEQKQSFVVYCRWSELYQQFNPDAFGGENNVS